MTLGILCERCKALILQHLTTGRQTWLCVACWHRTRDTGQHYHDWADGRTFCSRCWTTFAAGDEAKHEWQHRERHPVKALA